MKRLTTILCLTALVACGGSGGDDDDDDDDDVTGGADAAAGGADAAAQPTIDAAPTFCTADSDYGSPTYDMQAGEVAGTPATPDSISVAGTINAHVAPDLFQVELYKGLGSLASGEIAPGTYAIEGAELNYGTCGVCLRMFTDFDGSVFADDYYATGGTITITQVSPKFEGSISNVTFEHVTIDASTFESTPHADGCTTSISALSWSITPEAL